MAILGRLLLKVYRVKGMEEKGRGKEKKRRRGKRNEEKKEEGKVIERKERKRK
jgi:hypothetical protein